jgi:hypothetical protein
MRLSRALMVVLWSLSVVGLGAAPAGASCAAPQSIKETADRADAVVYVRVVGLEGPPIGAPSRFALVKVERVLKGSVYVDIGVALGPEADAPPGTVVATSVDYRAERGTDHTLYMKQRAPGGYATDACAGSHPGAPTAEETAFFGQGKPPDRTPTGLDSTTDADRAIAAAVTLIALAGGAGAIVFAMRSRRAAAI